jgi:hypothetical protein
MPNFNKRGYRAAFQSQLTVPMMMTIGGRASVVSDDSNSSNCKYEKQLIHHQYDQQRENDHHHQQQQSFSIDDDDSFSCVSSDDDALSIGSFKMTAEEMKGFSNDDVQYMFHEFSEGLRQLPPSSPSPLSPKRGRIDHQQRDNNINNKKKIIIDLTIDSRDDDHDDDGSFSVSSLGSFGTPLFQQQDGEINTVFDNFKAFGDEENYDTMNIDCRLLGKDQSTMFSSPRLSQGTPQTNTNSFDITPSPSLVRKTLIPKVTFSPTASPLMTQTSRCNPELQQTITSSSNNKPNLLTPSPTHSPWVQKGHQQVQFLSTHDVPGLGSADSPKDTIVRRVKPVVTATRAWEAVDEQMLMMAVDALNKKRNDFGSEAYWNEVGRRYFAGTRTGDECEHHWTMKATREVDAHGKPPLAKSSSSAKRGKKTAKKSRRRGKSSEGGTKDTILLDGTPWSAEEDRLLTRHLDMLGNKWLILPRLFPNRSLEDVQERFDYLERGREMERECFADDDWMNF